MKKLNKPLFALLSLAFLAMSATFVSCNGILGTSTTTSTSGTEEINTGFSGTFYYTDVVNGFYDESVSKTISRIYTFTTGGGVWYTISEDYFDVTAESDDSFDSSSMSVYTKNGSTLTWEEEGKDLSKVRVTATLQESGNLMINNIIYVATTADIYVYSLINIPEKKLFCEEYALRSDGTYLKTTKTSEKTIGREPTRSIDTENGTYTISGTSITVTPSNGQAKTGTYTSGSSKTINFGEEINVQADDDDITNFEVVYTRINKDPFN